MAEVKYAILLPAVNGIGVHKAMHQRTQTHLVEHMGAYKGRIHTVYDRNTNTGHASQPEYILEKDVKCRSPLGRLESPQLMACHKQ